MKRPPFNRYSRSKRSPGNSRPRSGLFRRGAWSRGLRNLALLALAASLYQWTAHGSVSWPGELVERAGSWLGRPDAGWQHAREVLEKQGERREGRPLPDFDLRGRVVRVADGDTLSLLDDRGEQHKVRLFAIDTPELDQAHGKAAHNALSELVYQQPVGLVVVDVDDYQRKVATVYADERNINLALVAAGHAWWYRYHAPHERPLQRAEQQARAQSLGLWADEAPVPPWDWRRRHRGR